MVNGKKLLALGGDMRIVKMAESMAKEGLLISGFAFGSVPLDKRVRIQENLSEAAKQAEIIILGLPCTRDGLTVDAPFYDEKIYFKDLFKMMDKAQILIGGMLGEKVKALARLYNIAYIDYFDREELQISNAIPTAEGAIEIAIKEMPITLNGANALVVGYGRIGKVLSRSLAGLCAKVTVSARSFADLAWIEAAGHKAVLTAELCPALEKYDVVFNTVPAQVISSKEMKCLKDDCLVIDLASKPGGVDMGAARKMGVKVIWALSLPGKVAPVSAGEIIKKTILNIINELGV